MNKDDINKLFQKLDPGDERKAEIFNKIIDKKNKFLQNNNREVKDNIMVRTNNYKPKRLRLVAALSLVFILSITAYAVSNYYQDFLNRLIDWSISEDATQINISDTDSGYKITAESLFGERNVVYVMFSIEREDGKEIRIREKDGKTNFGVNTSMEYIGNSEDEDISDSKTYYALSPIDEESDRVYLLIRYSTNPQDIDGRTYIGENLHLEISGLNLGLLGREINGNWTLDIPLEYQDLGQVFDINEEFEYGGEIAKLEKIYYSPFDIKIYFTSEKGALKEMSLNDFNDAHHIDIKLKDGNYIPRTGGNAGGDNLGSYYYKHLYTVEYGEIELEKIGSIVVGDTEIPINLK